MSVELALLIILTWEAADSANGQQTPKPPSGQYGQYSTFDPTMGIAVIVLVCVFVFLGIFSVILRECSDNSSASSAAARLFRSPGLDKSVIESFPVLTYSKVRTNRGASECTICVGEFDKTDTVRVLPTCGHVFHPGCIDTWLASHVTCPVCRANLRNITRSQTASYARGEEMVIPVNEFDRVRTVRLPRSHSTGHSLSDEGCLRGEWSSKKGEGSGGYFIGCGGEGKWVFSMTPPFVCREGDAVNCGRLWTSVKGPLDCEVKGGVDVEGESSTALARPLV